MARPAIGSPSSVSAAGPGAGVGAGAGADAAAVLVTVGAAAGASPAATTVSTPRSPRAACPARVERNAQRPGVSVTVKVADRPGASVAVAVPAQVAGAPAAGVTASGRLQSLKLCGTVPAFVTRKVTRPAGMPLAGVSWKRCSAGAPAVYSWKVDGRAVELERTRTACVFSFSHFKALGRHRVAVTASGTGGQEAGSNIVVLRDLLIVGIGDSNASGEGNPDVAGTGARWIDPRCDRSHFGYQAQTASVLEHASDETSVTFVHLACSGASLAEGLLGAYRGIADPGVKVSDIPPQIGALKALVKARPADGVKQRPIDALLVSIGVNDLHFGAIVKQCLERTDCFNSQGLPGTRPGETVAQAVQRWLAALPARYDRLAARSATR